jgi:hypothetical protein
VTTLAPAPPPLIPDLPRLAPPRRAWTRWLSQAISLLLLGAVLFQFRHVSLVQLRDAVPSSPWFVPTLLALYLALPVADWIIFRRLWGLPPAGFPVLVGKRISNELLLMYSGELYFYLWARQRTGLVAAPFGTIKDVNILSALAGNVLTLGMLVFAYPFISRLQMGHYAGAAVASAAVMLTGSMLVLLFSRRLFTLTRPLLVWVTGVHLVRLVAGVLLCALSWSLAISEAPLGLWIALATIRMLVARLPLVPNKELLFAAVAVFLVGEDKHLAAVIAMTSTAMLLLHLVFGALVALWAFAGGDRLGLKGAR